MHIRTLEEHSIEELLEILGNLQFTNEELIEIISKKVEKLDITEADVDLLDEIDKDGNLEP